MALLRREYDVTVAGGGKDNPCTIQSTLTHNIIIKIHRGKEA
jgi:hypothetical protein